MTQSTEFTNIENDSIIIVIGPPKEFVPDPRSPQKKECPVYPIFLLFWIVSAVLIYIFWVPSFLEKQKKNGHDGGEIKFFAYFAFPVLGNAVLWLFVYLAVIVCIDCGSLG